MADGETRQKTLQELEAENSTPRAEIERLKTKSALTMFGAARARGELAFKNVSEPVEVLSVNVKG